MPIYYLRFYEELNDFLPPEKRKTRFAHFVKTPSSIKNVVESIGVPHAEIDLILANGASVDFSYQPQDQDEISIYPMFESLDISPVTRLQSRPLRRNRFVLDVPQGKLAHTLRMMGFDSAWEKNLTNAQIIHLMKNEHRTILTRNRGLLKRRAVTHGYFLRAVDPRKQAAEVLRRFDLFHEIRPLTRCLVCNGPIAGVDKEKIRNRLPPRVQSAIDKFQQCPHCGRVYWHGSHAQRMLDLIELIQQDAASQM
jgi:uncharacterized protein